MTENQVQEVNLAQLLNAQNLKVLATAHMPDSVQAMPEVNPYLSTFIIKGRSDIQERIARNFVKLLGDAGTKKEDLQVVARSLGVPEDIVLDEIKLRNLTLKLE